MYIKPIEILKKVRKQTDEIILFHSIAGKDSIALLELCNECFRRVVCVYMYIVKDLQHINKYKYFFQKHYPKNEWYEIPHFALSSWLKCGLYGIKQHKTQKNITLAMLMKQMRNKVGTEWICFGSKQADGLARRLQLKTYEHEAIDWNNKKVYPLSKLRNKEVLSYIRDKDLIEPLSYGIKGQSSSTNIGDPLFLKWCKENYPEDYEKIKNTFPDVEIIMYRYQNNML